MLELNKGDFVLLKNADEILRLYNVLIKFGYHISTPFVIQPTLDWDNWRKQKGYTDDTIMQVLNEDKLISFRSEKVRAYTDIGKEYTLKEIEVLGFLYKD